MATKACKYIQSPRSTEIEVGETVTARFRIKNCGDEGGNFYLTLFKDGVNCKSQYNKWLEVGEKTTVYFDCEFAMPNKVVKLRFVGGHAEGSVWREDYSDTVTLTPKVIKKDTKTTCYSKTTEKGVTVTLEAKVKEKDTGKAIGSIKVKFYVDGSYVDYDYTNSSGMAYKDYTPTSTGSFTIKAMTFGTTEYNGSSDTCTLTVTKPPKKNTGISCYERNTDAGVSVSLKARLKDSDGNRLKYKNVKFYAAGSYVGSDHTNQYGDAYTDYTPTAAGSLTIRTDFEGDEDYYSSSDTCILTVITPKKDTVATCDNTEAKPGEKIWLSGHLHDADGVRLHRKKLEFYIDNVFKCSGFTSQYGTVSCEATVPSVAGTYTIKVVFTGDDAYNPDEGTCTLTVKEEALYKINAIVKDQDGKPLAEAYVDIDKYTEGVWREVSCSETVITKGTCSTDAFAGDKDNIKTDYNGKVSFTLPFLPGGIPNKYGFRVGKVGYLNKEWHEDWTDRQETEPQPAPQGGTYDFVFSLTDATKANKFIRPVAN